MTASIARTYDRWAPDYDRRWRRYTDVTLGVLLDHLVLDRSPDVLDVGCGTGALLARLRVRAPQARLLGVDVNPSMLRIACASRGRSWRARRSTCATEPRITFRLPISRLMS